MFALCFSTFCISQPVITENDLSMIGENDLVTFFDTRNEIVTVTEGENQVWDFSQTGFITLGNFPATHLAPSETPFAELFPTATIVGFLDTTAYVNYEYLRVDEQGLSRLGITADPFIVFMDDPRLELVLPAQYGTSWEDDWAYSVRNNDGTPAQGTAEGHFEGLYAGYGTLITPDGTAHPNTALFKIVDTSVVHSPDGDFPSVIVNYSFEVKGCCGFLYGEQVPSHEPGNEDGITTFAQYVRYGRSDQPGQAISSYDRFVAHMALAGGNFDTTVFAGNPLDTPQQVVFHPFDSQGGALESVEREVPAGGFLALDRTDLFPDQASHFTVSGCDACRVSVGYRAATGGGTAHIGEVGQPARTFTVYTGEWDILFDAVAIVNVGTEPAAVTGSMIDPQGDVRATHVFSENLAPGEKVLGVFDTVFPVIHPAIVRIETTQDAVATFLRGSRDGRFLYQNIPQ